MIYQDVQPTWHHIRLIGGIIYGLHFGPDSNGSHFSIIVQNILRSLQGKRYITLFVSLYLLRGIFVEVLDINFWYTSNLFDPIRLDTVAKFSKGLRIQSNFHLNVFNFIVSFFTLTTRNS